MMVNNVIRVNLDPFKFRKHTNTRIHTTTRLHSKPKRLPT